MKACKIFLLSIFLFFCQAAFAQTTRSPATFKTDAGPVNSSISITINGENFLVAGIVPDADVKDQVIETIKAQLAGNFDFSRIGIQPGARPFQTGWLKELGKELVQIKSWTTGVLVFGIKKLTDEDYPPLSEEIARARFELSDGRTVSLNDYSDKTIVLFFMEFWAKPALDQARALTEFYPRIASRNAQILSISMDDSDEEKADFRKAFERSNFPFAYGWTDRRTFLKFVKISRVDAIPQIILIKNGRLRGVFVGGAPKVTEKLKETILKTLDEENL